MFNNYIKNKLKKNIFPRATTIPSRKKKEVGVPEVGAGTQQHTCNA